MSTIKTSLTEAKFRLRDAGIPSYALDAELLLVHVLSVRREYVIGNPEHPLEPEQYEAFNHLISRREAREPLSHILKKREFWGREFLVTRDTLDPRPDSETLIEAILTHYKGKKLPEKILDLGTGTGCLLLTLLSEFSMAYGVGVDIHPPALEVAKVNAKQLMLEKRVQFLLQCWAEGVTNTFDVIISNPPYIRNSDIAQLEPEVSRYEPRVALVGGEDGLHCYRELIPQLSRLLDAEGITVLEIGEGQAADVSRLLHANGLTVTAVIPDFSGIERCVIAQKLQL